MSKKKDFMKKLEGLAEAKKQIKEEQKKLVVECAHQNANGKLKLYPVNDRGDFKCKYCEAVFNMNPKKKEELEKAVNTIHDAIQQIRCFSDVEEDAKTIKVLGEVDFNLSTSIELYERIVNAFSKNGKKKKKNHNNHNNDSFGSYGSNSLSFIGGKKK